MATNEVVSFKCNFLMDEKNLDDAKLEKVPRAGYFVTGPALNASVRS